jgi:hypothetical protein
MKVYEEGKKYRNERKEDPYLKTNSEETSKNKANNPHKINVK